MPSKGTSGVGVRGRGRGRGRGGAASTRPDITPTVEPFAEANNTTSALSTPPAITTPNDSQNDSMDVDSTLSPATQPTETPAPTPVRPPPILPPPSLLTARSTTTTKKVSKFKPNAIRSDPKKLARLEQEERERVAKQNSDQARANRGTFRRGGRGDAMGRGTRSSVAGVASGPFAAAAESEKRLGVSRQAVGGVSSRGGLIDYHEYHATGGIGGGRGRISTSGTRFKTERTTEKDDRGKSKFGESFPEPSYPDDDDTPRVDIDQINIVSSDDDEPIVTGSRYKGKGNSAPNVNKGGQKPIRLLRLEHKNRVAQVNTDPIIKTDEKDEIDAVMVDETRSAPPSKALSTAGVYVKLEPGTEAGPEPSQPLPDFKHPLAELEAVATPEVADGLPVPKIEPSSPTLRKSKPRTPHSRKDKKPIIQTAEDRAEYNRHLEDIRVLQNELGNLQTTSQSRDSDGNVDMADDLPGTDPKEGRLYLFQFPPVLPKLYNPLAQPKPGLTGHANAGIKTEGDDDVEMVGLAPTSNLKIDLTKGTEIIKDDKKETVLKKEDTDISGGKKEKEKFVEEEGFIGKLIVRESGRVELDWGGTRMLVGRGIPTGFLTSGVLLDPMQGEKGKENLGDQGSRPGSSGGGIVGLEPAKEGKATGMGQIMGKFVVTPDWESMM